MLSTTKYLFICLLFLSCSGATAQEDSKPSKHAIKMDFKLPTAFGNGAFKGIMNGLVDLDFGYQYHFQKSNIIVNTGIKYGLWDVETSFFAGTFIEGRLQTYTPFIGIGYRKIITESVFMDWEIKGGYSIISTQAILCAENYRQTGVSIEPKVNIYLKGSEMLYFGANINYHLIGAEFSESNICIDDFPGLSQEASQGYYSYFSIGLGFYAYIPQSKKR
ncbi:MAG: hypothetical protein ACI8Q1_000527 [Parvicella sp.]